MKTTITAICALFFSNSLLFASLIISIDVDDFVTAGDNSSSLGVLTGGTGTGQSQTYNLTNLDFTSIGGTVSETITFSVDFSATSSGNPVNVGYKSWGDAFVPGGNTDVGDTFTASLGTISSSFTGGTVSFEGFTNAFISALQSGESANVTHDGGTIIVPGPAENIPFSPSSFFTVTPTAGAMNIGGFDLQISAAAVPEPSSALLLVGCLSSFCFFRRKRRACA